MTKLTFQHVQALIHLSQLIILWHQPNKLQFGCKLFISLLTASLPEVGKVSFLLLDITLGHSFMGIS